MGGKALNQFNINTVRYTKEQYEDLCLVVKEKLLPFFEKVHITDSYRTKDSFGDIDVLVSSDNINFNVKDKLKEIFNYDEIYCNGKVYSFNYGLTEKDFQIDVILIPLKTFEIASVYIGTSDLGNLMGRIAHRMGLSYGHEGLKFTYRTEDNHIFGEVILSTDPEKIFTFLGYDWNVFLKGFETLEDVFKYVMSTEYFDHEIYDLNDEEMNHQNRTRNRKRTSYIKFLDHVREDQNKKVYFVNRNKTVYIMRADRFFPEVDLYKWMEEQVEQARVVARRRLKFNGDLVREWTGLEGKQLGVVIKEFKGYVTNEELDNPEITTTYIKNSFLRWFEAHKHELL